MPEDDFASGRLRCATECILTFSPTSNVLYVCRLIAYIPSHSIRSG